MKSYKLISSMIGGWLLLIVFDSANGKLGLKGAAKLAKPLQIAFLATKTIRTLIMFLLAVVCFFLVTQQSRIESQQRTSNSWRNGKL